MDDEDLIAQYCHQCAAAIGERHDPNCDVGRCSECGGQYFGDSCENSRPTVWTGDWPGVAECREFNLYTEPDSPWGVTEDLNTLITDPRFTWDKSLERFVLR